MLKSSSISRKDEITSLAIGGFDGMHKAHLQLLSRLDENGALLVIEKGFDEALTPKEERCRYTRYPCLFLQFSEIKSWSAEAFVLFLQKQFPSLKKIVVGYDFRFGKNRRGTPALLATLPGVEVEVVAEQKEGDISIHAKTIRHLLKLGDLGMANKLLGRAYAIRGAVVKGQGLGAKALYPTLNIDADHFLLPKEGVYITEALLEERCYPALTFVGKRLSTDGARSVETHILDEVSLPYTPVVEVRFLRYLRENRKFEDLKALKVQIEKDMEIAKCYFQAGEEALSAL